MNAEAMTVPMVIDHWNEYAPKRPAFVFVNHSKLSERMEVTFNDLFEMGLRFAGHLKSKGVRRDDRVVLFLANSPERVIAEAGIQYMGAVSVHGVCQVRETRNKAARCVPQSSQIYCDRFQYFPWFPKTVQVVDGGELDWGLVNFCIFQPTTTTTVQNASLS